MRLLIFVMLVLLLAIKMHAQAAVLECFTDEPRRYEFNIGAQKVGSYEVVTDYKTGKLAGITYHWFILNVASLKNYDDYLTKRYTNGTPYAITYSLKCKALE